MILYILSDPYIQQLYNSVYSHTTVDLSTDLDSTCFSQSENMTLYIQQPNPYIQHLSSSAYDHATVDLSTDLDSTCFS